MADTTPCLTSEQARSRLINKIAHLKSRLQMNREMNQPHGASRTVLKLRKAIEQEIRMAERRLANLEGHGDGP